jgi:hypothetical protein
MPMAVGIDLWPGRRYDEVTTEQAAVSFDVVPGPDGTARFKVKGEQYTPEGAGQPVGPEARTDEDVIDAEFTPHE